MGLTHSTTPSIVEAAVLPYVFSAIVSGVSVAISLKVFGDCFVLIIRDRKDIRKPSG